MECPALSPPPSTLEQGSATLVELGPVIGLCHGRSTLEGHTMPSLPGFTVRIDEHALTSDDKTVARVRVAFRNTDKKNIRTLVTLSHAITIDDIAVRMTVS